MRVQKHVRQAVCSSAHVPGKAYPGTDTELGWATPMLLEGRLPPGLPRPVPQPCRLTLLLSVSPCLSQMAAARHHAPLCSALKAAMQGLVLPHHAVKHRRSIFLTKGPVDNACCSIARTCVQGMFAYCSPSERCTGPQQQNNSQPMTPITRNDSLSDTACKGGHRSLPVLLISETRHALTKSRHHTGRILLY